MPDTAIPNIAIMAAVHFPMKNPRECPHLTNRSPAARLIQRLLAHFAINQQISAKGSDQNAASQENPLPGDCK